MKKVKRMYVRPNCDVVELRVNNQLLAGSISVTRDGLIDGGEEIWNAPSGSRMLDDLEGLEGLEGLGGF